MRIEPSLPFQPGREPERTESSAAAAAQERAAAAAPKGDQARLSLDADKFRDLHAQLTEPPEVPQERLEALQRAIRAGRYQVSSEQIASAIYSELFE